MELKILIHLKKPMIYFLIIKIYLVLGNKIMLIIECPCHSGVLSNLLCYQVLLSNQLIFK